MSSESEGESQGRAVTSPIATGGSGTFFEQHVNASYLAVLLVGGLPPVLTDCVLEEVSFQTEHLGWQTDDVLLIGKSAQGVKRHLAAQVKRAFKINQSDSDCVKAFKDFWLDFNNKRVFQEGRDQLALILLAGGDAAVSQLRS